MGERGRRGRRGGRRPLGVDVERVSVLLMDGEEGEGLFDSVIEMILRTVNRRLRKIRGNIKRRRQTQQTEQTEQAQRTLQQQQQQQRQHNSFEKEREEEEDEWERRPVIRRASSLMATEGATGYQGTGTGGVGGGEVAVCYREAFVGLDTALARAGRAAATAGDTGHPGSFIPKSSLHPLGLGSASLKGSLKGSPSGDGGDDGGNGDGSNHDDDTGDDATGDVGGARVTEGYTEGEIASMSEEEVEDVEGWTLAYDFKPAMVAMYRRSVLLPLAKVPRQSPMPRKVILVSRQPSENSDWNGIYKRGIPRQILNEASLWAGLQEDALAARRLVLGRERMTFAEQITSINEAAVLVHMHGAAMAGALFMQPGTVFLALHAYDTHTIRE